MSGIAGLLAVAAALSPLATATAVQLPGAPPFDARLQERLRAAAVQLLEDGPPRTRHRNGDGAPRYVNRLVFAASPYLQQHAFNPVNWQEWSEEAFRTATRENKPVFLSIGYSTCHWCHVMEEESFDNEDIARRLNENFVCIKVDREARPDIDHVYVEAIRRLTGNAGWPLTVFLTPDRKPFYGGTYYPPQDRDGRVGLPRLLETVARFWREKPEVATASASDLVAALQAAASSSPESIDLSLAVLHEAKERAARSFDATHGGLRGAPKFPQPHVWTFLLRHYQRTGDSEALRMAEVTLDRMAGGGIHDALGGGFHRYSVDAEWRVPHFEKMLCDQAILARAYLEAYHATAHPRHARVARDVLDYVLRDLTSPEGTFYAAEDADSEREEGRFYLWSRLEILAVLGTEDGELIADFYGVTAERSGPPSLQRLPPGRSPLHVRVPADQFAKTRGIDAAMFRRKLAGARQQLLAARAERPRPLRDDKRIVAWNGAMISSLAYGATVLGDPAYARAAERAAAAILERSTRHGRLPRFFRHQHPSPAGFLDDYAFLLLGLTDLYEATFDSRWLREARHLAGEMLRRFADAATGGLRYVAADHEAPIAPPDTLYDGALPSASSVAALALLRLGRLTMNRELEGRGRTLLALASQSVANNPLGHMSMLMAADFAIGPVKEIVIAGPPAATETRALLEVLRQTYVPRSVRLSRPPADEGIVALAPFLSQQTMKDGKPTAYVCEEYVCDLPTTDPQRLRELLRRPAGVAARALSAPESRTRHSRQR